LRYVLSLEDEASIERAVRQGTTPRLIISFASIASASAPSSQVVSFKFIAETRRLVLTLLGGDITVISPDDEHVSVRIAFSKSNGLPEPSSAGRGGGDF
jgi:hypothetical protein